jgi:hypothetical protein
MIYAADEQDCPEATDTAIDIVELAPDPRRVTRFRADHPGPVIAVAAKTAETARACVAAGAELLVGDHLAEVAGATGTGLVCSDPARASSAGVRPDGVIVEAGDVHGHLRLEELVRAGHAVLVTAVAASPDAAGPGVDAATLAALSVHAWLGARVFRVRAPDAPVVRQALDMVASIQGLRPPAVSRRGLV